MLARARQLTYHSDTVLRTPCLVPSFSSRGFPKITKDGREISAVSEALDATAEVLNDAMLVSAFDLHHGLLPNCTKYWTYPQVLFIDSGGYETGVNDDLSDIASFPAANQPWSSDFYLQTLKSLPDSRRIVAVSYDADSVGKPLTEQVAAARSLFEAVPQHISTILVKPTTTEQRFLPNNVLENDAHLLRHFDIIGVTEKELGNSLSDRLIALAKLRASLDQASISAPIHVFGSLDPLMTPLYFVAGAEIFDGLAWLRYGFLDGLAVYRDAFVCQSFGPQCKRSRGRLQMLAHNLTTLDRMRDQMRRFAASGNYDIFGSTAGLIREIHESITAEIGGA